MAKQREGNRGSLMGHQVIWELKEMNFINEIQSFIAKIYDLKFLDFTLSLTSSIDFK